MSYLYMAPCPPPFVTTNEFQQHAYSRNLPKDIVLALMLICHIPADLSTPGSTTSYRPTSTSDVKHTTISTPFHRPTSTSNGEATTSSTPSNRPTSTSNVKPTFTGFISTTDKSETSEEWLIPRAVVVIFVVSLAVLVIFIFCQRLRKRKLCCPLTQDNTDAPGGVILKKFEGLNNTEEECSRINQIANKCEMFLAIPCVWKKIKMFIKTMITDLIHVKTKKKVWLLLTMRIILVKTMKNVHTFEYRSIHLKYAGVHANANWMILNICGNTMKN
ncbi:uncharacterized protein LOC127856951 isoform X2 [Dreissena polymorpha]|nr:uncharacterized protein LOC127856951 isoform X2 [Dreissena polymorpha]XP_052249125.1 uncharacterized protein LOC127856951 isoform X2 [Dreissena polymorpha]XP_052249126.1 uncharacterized protein LOC127856951 isoform X2 [Dreissena polymorpha]